jgi:hypothetical protein
MNNSMLSKNEIIENFIIASVACDKTIQFLRSQQIREGDARLTISTTSTIFDSIFK